MRKNKKTTETLEIYWMLDFHLRNAPRGLLPFMDETVPLPSSLDFADIIRSLNRTDDPGVRISCGRSLPEQQLIFESAEPYFSIINKYGGIGLMRKAFREWEKRYPEKGKVLREWSMKGTSGLETMAEIADNNGYTDASTPYKMRKSFLIDIAYDIFMQPHLSCQKRSNLLSNKRSNFLSKKRIKKQTNKPAKNLANDKS